MQASRRTFLKLAAAGGGAALLHQFSRSQATRAATADTGEPEKRRGALYDATRCVGCRACQNACKEWNDMPADPNGYGDIYDNPANLSAKTLTLIKYHETETAGIRNLTFCKYQCMHCEYPACAEACFVGAFTKTPEGPVVYDDGKCIGCRYCMVACPFGIPTFEWDDPLPWIKKCTFCTDRQKTGQVPACIEACPNGALKFGNRAELIDEARNRIESDPEKYVPRIYGETEAGGTSWLYLSPIPFDKLGFPDLSDEPTVNNVRTAINMIPPVLAGMTALMTGIFAFVKFRNRSKKEKV